MAKNRLSKENLGKIRQKLQQLRKEKKATTSGTTDISLSGSYVDVSYWYAFTYNGGLWTNATVTAKSGNLADCEIFLTPTAGGPRSADGFVLGNLGNQIDLGALTDLITTKPSMVHSELTGTTANGDFFQYQADLYVYEV
jgi:hypothetical protein